MKDFLKTALLVLAIVGTVFFFWNWNATRPTDEAGTKAMVEDWAHLKEQAKKYPLEDGK